MYPDAVPHRGHLFHRLWPLTRYVVSHLTILLGAPIFKVLNRTIVIGRENVGEEPNTLLLANHQSMLDGFIVGFAVFFPRSLIKPSVMPWHPAAQEHFFANPVLAWLSDNWKCIPVRPGRKDFVAMKRMERCLKRGIMTVFPEGTRSRDGRLLPPRSGIGYVMLKTRPKAIPVTIDGVDAVMPVGSFFPSVLHTVMIYYGPAVDLSEFYDREHNRETAQAAIEKVFAVVRRQREILKRYRRYRLFLLAKKPFFFRLYRD
jgi:1-acyl-sn-glycerol-3-phosphate acyltransferase